MRKAFISPSKYVQNEGALYDLGKYVKLYGNSALLIAQKDDVGRVKKQLDETSKKYEVTFVTSDFGGECSRQEVSRLKEVAAKANCEVVIGLGGGKAIDTAKCVADNLKPIIVCPTIAATDAPTSSSAVLYTPEGAFDDYAYFISNPNIVLVDTAVIANAPARFLVSGMGDALSTYFEARSCQQAFARVNASGHGFNDSVGTKTAMALALLCYETLLEDGLKAKLACEAKVPSVAFQNIVETNILLSGLGFESGGLAAAHAVHNGLTILEETHKFYHGEKVAFGTIVHLVLENADTEELATVINFCRSVGLPTCLKDLGVINITHEKIMAVAKTACASGESIYNMPFPVSVETVYDAILAADKIGSAL